MSETKVCTGCKQELDIKHFSKDKNRKDGLQYHCKFCNKKYVEENKDIIKEKQKEYCKEYCKTHREERRLYKSNYDATHKEEKKDYGLKYYEEHKENSSEYGKSHRRSKASFSTFAQQLTIDESPISDKEGYIQVKCTYCGKYFYPTVQGLTARVRTLNGKGHGECRLYCSENCKHACPVFYKHTVTPGLEQATSREVQPQLRQLVLARDEYQCVKCKKTIDEIELHCHHIDPVSMNAIESADLDNCTTLCIDCHHEVHGYSWCKVKC